SPASLFQKRQADTFARHHPLDDHAQYRRLKGHVLHLTTDFSTRLQPGQQRIVDKHAAVRQVAGLADHITQIRMTDPDPRFHHRPWIYTLVTHGCSPFIAAESVPLLLAGRALLETLHAPH